MMKLGGGCCMMFLLRWIGIDCSQGERLTFPYIHGPRDLKMGVPITTVGTISCDVSETEHS